MVTVLARVKQQHLILRRAQDDNVHVWVLKKEQMGREDRGTAHHAPTDLLPGVEASCGLEPVCYTVGGARYVAVGDVQFQDRKERLAGEAAH